MNHKTTLYFLLIFWWVSGTLSAQEVISTAGSVLTNSSGSISFTVGETVTATLGSAAAVLTQGFQQPPNLQINATDEARDFSVTVFPNPAGAQVLIRMDRFSGAHYRLLDMRGAVISYDRLTGTETAIDLSSLEPSVYILQVSRASEEEKTFRIVKQ